MDNCASSIMRSRATLAIGAAVLAFAFCSVAYKVDQALGSGSFGQIMLGAVIFLLVLRLAIDKRKRRGAPLVTGSPSVISGVSAGVLNELPARSADAPRRLDMTGHPLNRTLH